MQYCFSVAICPAKYQKFCYWEKIRNGYREQLITSLKSLGQLQIILLTVLAKHWKNGHMMEAHNKNMAKPFTVLHFAKAQLHCAFATVLCHVEGVSD